MEPRGGLQEVLEELSPIEDFSGSMSLSFSDPRFDEVKASMDECKDKDMTYAAPLFVTAEFINNNTGEIKSQTVFMGDFPLMTRNEALVFKVFDSDADAGVRFTAHTSFDDPNTAPDAAPRESIEMRALVFY